MYSDDELSHCAGWEAAQDAATTFSGAVLWRQPGQTDMIDRRTSCQTRLLIAKPIREIVFDTAIQNLLRWTSTR